VKAAPNGPISIAAVHSTPTAPSAAGNDPTVALNEEIGAVTNQLPVEAEDGAEGDSELFRGVVAWQQFARGVLNQLFKRRRVLFQRESQ
jgi:hypothetical protein